MSVARLSVTGGKSRFSKAAPRRPLRPSLALAVHRPADFFFCSMIALFSIDLFDRSFSKQRSIENIDRERIIGKLDQPVRRNGNVGCTIPPKMQPTEKITRKKINIFPCRFYRSTIPGLIYATTRMCSISPTYNRIWH